MMTIADVGPGHRRRPATDRTPPAETAVDTTRALLVPATLERADRMRHDEALARLSDVELIGLHSITERTLGLTERGAASYPDLARGLATVETLLTERNLRGRRLGRRIDPLCTARERLKAVTAPVWSDHIAAMHLLVEAGEREAGQDDDPAAAARRLIAAVRAAPQEFGRPKKKMQADWDAIAAALGELLAIAAERRRTAP